MNRQNVNKLLIGIFAFMMGFGSLLSNNKISDFFSLNRDYFGLEYQRSSNSSFYDFSGEQIYTIPDSIDIWHEQEYTYEISNNIINFVASQGLLTGDNYNLYAGIILPISINHYERLYKSKYDTIPNLYVQHSNTVVPQVSMKLGADFKMANVYVGASVIYNQSFSQQNKFEIFDTFYSSLVPEITFIYNAKTSYFHLDAAYRKYIDSPLSDEVMARFTLGLTTVEASALRAYLEYVRSVDKVNTEIAFLPEKYQLQSEQIKLGFDFQLLVEKAFIPKLGYELAVGGINNVVFSKFSIGAAIKLDLIK